MFSVILCQKAICFFRYLFALGTMGTTRVRRFWVFDLDNSGKLKGRYEKLLGRSSCRRFEYMALNFSEAINALKRRII